MYIHTCIYAYIHAYMHTYIHAYMHTYIGCGSTGLVEVATVTFTAHGVGKADITGKIVKIMDNKVTADEPYEEITEDKQIYAGAGIVVVFSDTTTNALLGRSHRGRVLPRRAAGGASGAAARRWV